MTNLNLLREFSKLNGFEKLLGLTNEYLKKSDETLLNAANNVTFEKYESQNGDIIVAKIGNEYFKGGMHIVESNETFDCYDDAEFDSNFSYLSNPSKI